MGHLFTQGTVDSNEVWLDVTVTSAGKVIGRSGAVDPQRGNEVDPWAHFRECLHAGQRMATASTDGTPRISLRRCTTIRFRPVQVRPCTTNLQVPQDVSAPITVEVRLLYRKFDQRYMDFVARTNEQLGIRHSRSRAGQVVRERAAGDDLGCRSSDVSRGRRATSPVSNPIVDFPTWQRWNDYGIGLLLKGKAELRQATEAFTQVEALGRWDGPLNLARVYNTEGRLDDAVAALQRGSKYARSGRLSSLDLGLAQWRHQSTTRASGGCGAQPGQRAGGSLARVGPASV